MDRVIPLVQFTFDENDPNSGMKAISLVDEPAIESDFQFFNNQKPKPQYFKVEGYEGIVQGLALIPDKMILRYDMDNNPYYGYFTVDTIKKLKNKFHKELMMNNINTDHSNNEVNGYLTESFIIEDEHQLASVKAKGINDATIGSWFVQYKIEDQKTFQRVIDGELKGFSIEAFLHAFLKVNNNNPNKLETKMNKLIEKFEQLLNEMKAPAEATPVAPVEAAKPEEKKYEVAKIYDGVDSVEWSEIGAPVNIVLPDGSKKVAGEGSYITDTQKELVVDAAGNLVEIRSIEKEIEKDEPQPEMIPVEQATANVQAEAAKFQKEVDAVKAEKIALAKEIETLKAEVAALKKAPLAEPVIVTKEKAEFSKEEFEKLSTVEKIAIKNGIELPKVFAKK